MYEFASHPLKWPWPENIDRSLRICIFVYEDAWGHSNGAAGGVALTETIVTSEVSGLITTTFAFLALLIGTGSATIFFFFFTYMRLAEFDELIYYFETALGHHVVRWGRERFYVAWRIKDCRFKLSKILYLTNILIYWS